MVRTGNLKRDLPARPLPDEVVELLLERPGLRIERIVSTGQTTPEGHWYDQETDEWVLVVAGAARLRIEGEATDRELGEGDWILLPAHCRHRVTWTRAEPPTVWLASTFSLVLRLDLPRLAPPEARHVSAEFAFGGQCRLQRRRIRHCHLCRLEGQLADADVESRREAIS